MMNYKIIDVLNILSLRLLLLVTLTIFLSLQTGCAYFADQQYYHLSTPTPLNDDKLLIIGFLGGSQRWDDDSRGVRKLAVKLDDLNFSNVEIETFQNKRRDLAMEFIQHALDRNEDNHLDAQERASARLVLYGQSLGGSAVVKLSRDLEKIDIPILLTVQVDSFGWSDHKIPANVYRAANLFQRNEGFIRGEDQISAEDPALTNIIANLEFDYESKDVDMSSLPWARQFFTTPHSKMDADPEVWAIVENLILEEVSKNRKGVLAENFELDSDLIPRG